MYWAAGRNTTKVEDVAYSLMGIFDVNMPLLYGEGVRAFTRLQEEIMKKFTDESLFAWAVNTGLYDSLGLLARSPDDFNRSSSIFEKVRIHRTSSFALTNRGLQLEVILLQPSTILGGSDGLASPFSADMVAVLNCMDEPSGKSVGIILTPSWVLGKEAKFFRSKYHGLVYIDPDIPSLSEAIPDPLWLSQR